MLRDGSGTVQKLDDRVKTVCQVNLSSEEYPLLCLLPRAEAKVKSSDQ
jgi:hypothetical protein